MGRFWEVWSQILKKLKFIQNWEFCHRFHTLMSFWPCIISWRYFDFFSWFVWILLTCKIKNIWLLYIYIYIYIYMFLCVPQKGKIHTGLDIILIFGLTIPFGFELQIKGLGKLKGIVHPKWRWTPSFAILDKFVSSEQIWRHLAFHHLLTNGSSAVNGCRQNAQTADKKHHNNPHDSSPLINILQSKKLDFPSRLKIVASGYPYYEWKSCLIWIKREICTDQAHFTR